MPLTRGNSGAKGARTPNPLFAKWRKQASLSVIHAWPGTVGSIGNRQVAPLLPEFVLQLRYRRLGRRRAQPAACRSACSVRRSAEKGVGPTIKV